MFFLSYPSYLLPPMNSNEAENMFWHWRQADRFIRGLRVHFACSLKRLLNLAILPTNNSVEKSASEPQRLGTENFPSSQNATIADMVGRFLFPPQDLKIQLWNNLYLTKITDTSRLRKSKQPFSPQWCCFTEPRLFLSLFLYTLLKKKVGLIPF